MFTQIYSGDNQRYIICVLTDGVQVIFLALIFILATYRLEGYKKFLYGTKIFEAGRKRRGRFHQLNINSFFKRYQEP